MDVVASRFLMTPDLMNVYRHVYNSFLLAVLCLLAAGCRRPEPLNWHFYYWKLEGGKELQQLSSALAPWPASSVYVHILDVGWDARQQAPVPQASLRLSGGPIIPESRPLVPVIFIKNDVLHQADSARLLQLSEKLLQAGRQFLTRISRPEIRELQIDCDWTAQTRDKYFYLLEQLKAGDPALNLSVTIRLYPYKYRKTMGIPPADYGVLMCYNMSPYQAPDTRNSILDPDVLRQYLVPEPYPYPLKAALPLFGWYVWQRQETVKGIRYFPAEFYTSRFLKPAKGNRYAFTKDTLIDATYFRKGDILRNEFPEKSSILESVELLKTRLPELKDIIFYHWDEALIHYYAPTIESLMERY